MSALVHRISLLLVLSLFFQIIVHAQPVVTIGQGNGQTTGAPMWCTGLGWDNSYHISVLLSSEIGYSGQINGIAWDRANNAGYTAGDATLEIYLIHISSGSVSDYLGGSWLNMLPNATLCYSSDSVSIFTGKGWQQFWFQQPFTYNGTDNLAVMVSWHRPASSSNELKWTYTSVPDGRSRTWAWASGYNYPYSSQDNGRRPNVELLFQLLGNQDCGISGIPDLPNTIQAGVDTAFSVNLRNYGYHNLDSARINWELDGIAMPEQQWTGNLATYEEVEDIFIDSLNLPFGWHKLKVWTEMPNGHTDLGPVNDSMQKEFLACSPMHGYYTAGGANDDFPSPEWAIELLTKCGIDDTVYLEISPGYYVGNLTIGEIPGASDSAHIFIRPSTNTLGDVVLVEPSSAPLRLVGCDHVRIEKLEVINLTSASSGSAITLSNGNEDLEIRDCRFESAEGNVISISGTTNNCIIEDNLIEGGVNGIVWNGSSQGGNRFNANILRNWSEEAMYFSGQYGIQVSGNHATTSLLSDGFDICMLNNCDGPVLMEGNIIECEIHHGNVNPRFFRVLDCEGAPAAPVVIANNLFHYRGTDTDIQFLVKNSSRLRIYHNTLINHKFSLEVNPTDTGIYINNNLFFNNLGLYTINTNNSQQACVSSMDFNNYYTTGSTLAKVGGANIADLAALQTAFGKDLNSVSIDPEFRPGTAARPESIQMDDLGTGLPLVSVDIHGKNRSLSSPDIGAWEYDIFPYEIELLEVILPEKRCDLGLTPITVKARSNGYLSTSNIPLNFRKPNGSLISEVYTDSISFRDTLTYTFTTLADMTTQGDTTLRLAAFSALAADSVPENDTTYLSVDLYRSTNVPVSDGQKIYKGSSAELFVKNPDSARKYYWYDNPASMVHLHEGAHFHTPSLQSDQVFWVNSVYRYGSVSYTWGPGSSPVTDAPFNGYNNYSWCGMIYDAAGIGGTIFIENLAFNVMQLNSPASMSGQKIFLGHTSASTWSNTGKPDTSVLQKVFEGDITWTSTGWYEISLQLPFDYNGVDKLVIYWENNSGNAFANPPVFSTMGIAQNAAIYNSDNQSLPGSPGFYTHLPDIRLGGASNGCISGRTSDTVLVYEQVTIGLQDTTHLCKGDSIQFSPQISGGIPPLSFHWTPSEELSDPYAMDPWAWPAVDKYYHLQVTDPMGTVFNASAFVEVKALPEVSLAPFQDICVDHPPIVLTGGIPPGGYYYVPGISVHILDPALADTGWHRITYIYQDTNTSCYGEASRMIYIGDCAGNPEAPKNQALLRVYPNPSRGTASVEVENTGELSLMQIYSSSGNIIREEKLSKQPSGPIPIDLRAHPPGVYHIRILTTKGTLNARLIMQ